MFFNVVHIIYATRRDKRSDISRGYSIMFDLSKRRENSSRTQKTAQNLSPFFVGSVTKKCDFYFKKRDHTTNQLAT